MFSSLAIQPESSKLHGALRSRRKPMEKERNFLPRGFQKMPDTVDEGRTMRRRGARVP